MPSCAGASLRRRPGASRPQAGPSIAAWIIGRTESARRSCEREAPVPILCCGPEHAA
jgi:hypothetical protein